MLKHYLVSLLFTISLVYNSVLFAEIKLPQMGDSSGQVISPVEEKALGDAFMRELRRSATIVDDPETMEYIQALGYQIVAQAQYPMAFNFFILDTPSINAFAAPGGYIGLNSGLILETQTESELASVLAHEVAHITQRHLPRAFEQASKMSLPTAAAIIAAIVLASSDPQLAQAALATGIAAPQQKMINFTRKNEKEADNIGMQYLAGTHFDPHGMPNFFSRLHEAHRYNTNNLPEYLSTHPMTLSRIAESQSRAEQLPKKSDRSYESFYPFLKAKLRLRADITGRDSIDYYADRLQQNTSFQLSDRYGYALALLKNNAYLKASQQAEQLLKLQPENSFFIHLHAKVDIARGKYAEAIRLLEQALTIYPRHYPLSMLMAEALVEHGQADQARRLLLDLIYYRKPTPGMYQLFAKASKTAGFLAESHEALAEQHYLQGAIASAINQIDSALKTADESNFHLLSRLQARKKELTQELKLRTQLR